MRAEIERLKEAFVYGWNSVKINLAAVLSFFALMWTIRDGLLYVGLMTPVAVWVGIVLVLGAMAMIIGDMAKMNMGLKVARNQGVSFWDFWDGPMTTAKFVLGWLIYNIAVLIGLILFVIPGLWLVMRFQFWGYYVVEQRAGVVTAMRESFRLTSGKGKQLGLALVPMALAWVVAAPVALMAHVFIFRKMEMEEVNKKPVNSRPLSVN